MTYLFIYFFITALSGLLLWLSVVILYYARNKEYKYRDFGYTKWNFFLTIVPYILSILLTSYIFDRFELVIIFLLFGVFGVLGETLFSIIWKLYYDEPFWIYTQSSIFKGYSSLLNFVPWGVGGMIYLLVVELFRSLELELSDLVLIMWVIYSVLAFLMLFLMYISKGDGIASRFKKISIKNYLFFIFPFIFSLILITLLSSPYYLLYGLLAGLFAFICEYLYGKLCAIFLSKRLWIYKHIEFDNGHITPLSYVPFIMGAYFYLLIILMIEGLF